MDNWPDDMILEELLREDIFERNRRQRELSRVCNPHLQTTDCDDDYMQEGSEEE